MSNVKNPLVRVAGKDYTLKLPKDYLSFSQIDCYLTCPKQYEFSYVEGKKSAGTIEQFEGTVMHALLNDNSRYYIDKKKHMRMDDAEMLYTVQLQDHCDDTELKMTVKQKDAIQDRAMGFIEKFWREGKGPNIQPIACEERFEHRFAGVPVVGYIDLIEEWCVTDYKVTASSEYYDAEKSMQLDIYSVVSGKPVASYCCFEKRTGKIIWDTAQARNLVKVNRWLQVVVSRVAEGISKGVFPPCDPNKNRWCSARWCAHHSYCAGLYQ